jgi:hypothetical protein
MMTPQSEPQWKPTLARAIGLLIFAVAFAVLMWVEHRWRLSRGDYPGIGLSHTWYWYASNWTGIVTLLGVIVWKVVRWTRG